MIYAKKPNGEEFYYGHLGSIIDRDGRPYLASYIIIGAPVIHNPIYKQPVKQPVYNQ